MKCAVLILSLITIYNIPKTYSQNSSKVPGSSACIYYGIVNEVCNLTTVPVSSLPKECTAIMFMCASSNADFKVVDCTGIPEDEVYMKAVSDCGQPAFLYYGHSGSIQEWSDVLACNVENGGVNAKTEMQNLKTFLDEYKGFTGIVLEYLSFDPLEDTLTPQNLTANFLVYIEEMRSTFPDFGIGIELSGRKLASYYSSESPPEWLDFTVLDSSIDFYTVNLYDLNPCTAELVIGGTAPVNGNTNNTLEQLVCYFGIAGIPTEKVYYQYATEPIDPFDEDCATMAKVCAAQNNDGICNDNIQSYYEKGVFAKANGAGFIAMNIDKGDDPDGCCNCGQPYPGFHALLDGFNGSPTPPSCPQLDKTVE